MNHITTFKTGPTGPSVRSGTQTNPAQRSLGRAIYFVAISILAVVSQPATAGDDPNELFVKTCASCHSKDGKAETPAAKKLGVKDLSLSKLTDAQIVEQIMDGKQDTQSSSKMPAFKEKLTPEQIQSLVPLVKSFRK